MQQFVNELMALVGKFGAEDAVEVKEGLKPTKDFHAQRHSLLTVEQNLHLDAVCQFQAQIKTKGIK